MMHMESEKMLGALGTFLARSETKDFWRILGLVWDRPGISTREVIEQLRMGNAHGVHHRRLQRELQRMRDVGVLTFRSIPATAGGNFQHWVSELGGVLQVALAESRKAA